MSERVIREKEVSPTERVREAFVASCYFLSCGWVLLRREPVLWKHMVSGH